MNWPRHQAGFSLIEVMVAILILGVALAGLSHGITTALGSNKESEWQTTAALFAQGKIETLRAEGDLTDAETDGQCGPGLESYSWKETISPANIPGLHQVVVRVENAQSGQPIFELQTLLFAVPDEDETTRKAGTERDSKHKKKRRILP